MSGQSKGSAQNAELLQAIRATCLRHGCPEPNEFLAGVMAGVDPRYDVSAIYDLICSIGEKMPTAEEWDKVRNLVLYDPAYRPARVELGASIEAAKKLVDTRYPKLKTVELDGAVDVQTTATPLTLEELDIALRALDDTDF